MRSALVSGAGAFRVIMGQEVDVIIYERKDTKYGTVWTVVWKDRNPNRVGPWAKTSLEVDDSEKAE